MSNFLIALFFGAGAGVWVYNKLMKSTGGRAKDAAIAAGITAVLLLGVVWFLLATLLPDPSADL